jgi:hypothetical protein
MVLLQIRCTNSSGSIAAPDAAPQVDVYGASGNKVESGLLIPAADPVAQPGLFAVDLFLDSAFSPGICTAVYRWQVGGTPGGDLDYFEVLPGGDPGGPVIGLRYYECPQADYLVQHDWAGDFRRGKNPSL